jgi:hypothetical protein
VGTTTLATKSVCLAGVTCCNNAYSKYLTDSLLINPVLSAGETLTLCLSSKTIGGSTTGVNSSASVSCCQNGGSVWNVLSSVSNAGCTVLPAITLCCGDKLCYSLSTINSTPLSYGVPSTNICGCAELKLISATPYGFNPVVLNTGVTTNVSYTTTTTTSTTTIPPISVYISNTLNQSLTIVNQCLCAKIGTTPALSSGQGFRLCFTTATRSNSETGLPKPISAQAYIQCGSSCLNYACSAIGMLEPGDCNSGGYSYVDLDSNNINSFTLCLLLCSHGANKLDDFINCGNIVLNAISNTCGGNFILSNNYCIWAHSATSLCSAQWGGNPGSGTSSIV